MPLTRQKLDEAAYFLSQVEDLVRDGPREYQKLKYYLSAFVSAARSVTWTMRYEYGKIAGWEQWFKNTELDGEDRDLLRKFNDLRVRSVKKKPLDPSLIPWIVLQPPQEQEVPLLRGGKRLISIVNIRPGPDETTPLVVEGADPGWVLTIEELEDKDLVQMCQRYFEILSRLLNDCEVRFGELPSE